MDKYDLHHIATGGTLDSHWNPSKDTAVPNEHSIVPSYLEAVRLPAVRKLYSDTIFLRDSRDIGINDQDEVAARACESPHQKIFITSGTYLMPDIANSVLQHDASEHFERINKRIVVTGSIVPIKGYLLSDGGFNLGMSTAVLEQQSLKARVMIVMNGMCFDVSKGVKKDLTKASFASSHGLDALNYPDSSLIPAGGSIDFVPNGMDGFVPARESSIPRYLREQVALKRDFSAINPFVKDSRELHDEDLETLLGAVRSSMSDRILLTTGIYKMKEVQEYLRKNLNKKDQEKRIVITGSRMPLQISDMTDAPFNLGYALGTLAFVEPGVSIAVNGMLLEDNQDIIELIFTEEEKEVIKSTLS